MVIIGLLLALILLAILWPRGVKAAIGAVAIVLLFFVVGAML